MVERIVRLEPKLARETLRHLHLLIQRHVEVLRAWLAQHILPYVAEYRRGRLRCADRGWAEAVDGRSARVDDDHTNRLRRRSRYIRRRAHQAIAGSERRARQHARHARELPLVSDPMNRAERDATAYLGQLP